jgi:uncharacterized DUF497 family protein
MNFEFDPAKSDSNKIKHGLDFVEAQALWDGEVFKSPAISFAEPRQLVVGKIEGKHWTAVITERGVKIRIISVRRSRDKEIEIYENR